MAEAPRQDPLEHLYAPLPPGAVQFLTDHPQHPTVESFGQHFFGCSVCEISEDLELTLCPTGSTLQVQAVPFMDTPEDRAYLLHLADEAFNEAWHRNVVGGSRASESERPLDDHSDMGKHGAGSFLAVDGTEPRGRNTGTAVTPAVVDPPTTLIPGEYTSDDLDRLVR